MNNQPQEIQSEARYTFTEATGVLLGHEVGAGILSIPFLASLNNWYDYIWILALTFFFNVLLHLMIAELSLNNGGAQFVECMRNELFKGKSNGLTKAVTWVIFLFLGLSVIINCTAYITGSASVLVNWFGWPLWMAQLVYFAFAGLLVMFGMKLVGVCEKIGSYVLIGVILFFGVAMLFSPKAGALSTRQGNVTVVLGLYSIISFAMSAIMSVPTVVKGLNGDRKKIRGAIILSEILNTALIAILTVAAVLGAGAQNLDENHPASLDLGNYLNKVSSVKWLGRTIQILGGVFSIFAYSTSLWANTLDLRDMVSEQTKLGKRVSWLIAAAPSLIIAMLTAIFSSITLSKLSVLAGGVQVLAGAAIVISFAISRKKAERENDFTRANTITGFFGTPLFCALVILSSLVATVGSIVY